MQGRLTDHQADLRAEAEDRLLPGDHRLSGQVPRGVIGHSRVGLRERPGVGRGLRQPGDALSAVGGDPGGVRLQGQVVLPGAGSTLE